MSTASTQFEDERRLYAVIEKNHRDALKREQIRMARGDQPDLATRLMTSLRTALSGRSMVTGGRPRHEATGSLEVAGTPVAGTTGDILEHPSGVATSH